MEGGRAAVARTLLVRYAGALLLRRPLLHLRVGLLLHGLLGLLPPLARVALLRHTRLLLPALLGLLLRLVRLLSDRLRQTSAKLVGFLEAAQEGG